MKIGVLLHGSGVYDGTEIHEAVLSLLSIEEAGHNYLCFAPNTDQHHVINHLNGEEMQETRNVLIESARIARGEVKDIKQVSVSDIDALVMPGGFGTAKNITKWAFEGPDGEINMDVKQLLLDLIKTSKPIAGLCMSPTTIAKALEGSDYHAKLAVGTTKEASPYEIDPINQGMNKIGAIAKMKTVREIAVDREYKIVTAPCYMMEANITQIRDNIKQAIEEMISLV